MRRLKTANVRSERRGYFFRQGAELIIRNPAAISSTNIPSGQWVQVDGIWTSVVVGEGIGIGEEIVIEGECSAIDVEGRTGVIGDKSRVRCKGG